MGHHSQHATVLIVDDEPAYVEAYATMLGDWYTVRTATSGDEALDEIDDDVDVVLLDRRMPGRSGDQVLREIRARGLDCRVAMITAVEPEVDIVDMEFDEYLVKPVSREELNDVVENLLRRATFSERVQECFALTAKKTALEASVSRERLETSEEYRRLRRRLLDAESQAHEALDDLMAEGEIAAPYYDIES